MMRCRRAWRWLGLALIGAGMLSAVAFGVAWVLVDWSPEGADEYAGGLVLRDRHGTVMRVSLGDQDVDCRPWYRAERGDWIVRALVASEDGSFWSHSGVRPLSVLRALWQNLTSRRRVSGASTLSMQTVRLIRPHPKSLFEKALEAVRAMKMERCRDKAWILSQYLNRAPFGSNFVGVEAAAQGWFGKAAKKLGIGEAALLAGIVQAPSRYRPDRWLELALKRRDYVLGRMEALGFVTAEQAQAARAVVPTLRREARPFLHPHYCDWVLARLGRDREAQRRSGEITTPLDPDAQAAAEAAVASAAHVGGYSAAAVVVEVATGEVVALACSGDYFSSAGGQVNTALASRPAGSTLKPFLVALALDRGLVAPDERLNDVPRAYAGYRPANFDAMARGSVSLADALVLSLNLPFVELLNQVGVDAFENALRSLGFASLGGNLGLGLAIGNAEVTLVELTSAYAKLAHGGDGVLSPGACYLVGEMLSGAERSAASLGHVADVEVPRFAWKTGTSAAHRDAWTVMWNPRYAIGVWCGHLSGGFGDRTVLGLGAAAPCAWQLARRLSPDARAPWFEPPTGVAERRVCADSGLLASADCPQVVAGHALVGVTVARVCPLHVRSSEGRVAERVPVERLRLLRPEEGGRYCRESPFAPLEVLCQAAGVARRERLWWFVDGQSAAESAGSEPTSLKVREGRHAITCATADGRTATVSITVE